MLKRCEAEPHCSHYKQHYCCIGCREDIIGYIDRVSNSGMGKNKSLEYIRKYVERTESADTDMSEYSDRLWKIAYERGKAEGCMSEDCISRQAMRNFILENYRRLGLTDSAMTELSNEVKSLPSVTPTEVVRCKDCRWYEPLYKDKEYDCPQGLYVVYENDFCSHGERREP